MHQSYLQKYNFLKRNSIPILLYRSIPLTCAVALLLLACNLFMVSIGIDKTYATEEDEDSSEISDADSVDNADNTDINDTGIATYATTTINPTASLAIGGDATDKQVITAPGSVAYRKHTVTVEANDIKSYSLILSGPANLTSSTNTVISGTTGGFSEINLSGYSIMKENTWGYSWSDDALEVGNPSSGYYSALSPDGITLRGDKVSGYKVNFTKDLFFAAKFAEDAEPGHYTASVNLSLVATPRDVATGFGGILEMQAMTASICNAVAIGTTGSLEDTRDGNVYTVGKLSDGKCWMTQNLRITRETINAKDSSNTTGRITSADSNVIADYEIPASTTGAFSNAQSGSYYTNQQVRASVDNDYGAYYSYNVATVNTVATVSSGSATYDICPKGWRLPTGGSGGEFQALYNKGKSDWTTNNGKNGYWFGGAVNAAGVAFFPAAGLVSTSGLSSIDSYGHYWSSTSDSDTYAYHLYFTKSGVNPTRSAYGYKYNGFSVRCVAR